ncbi:hypothetical protein D3C78_1723670 [compost metagenome]
MAETMGRISAKLHARADADVAEGILPYHSEEEIVKAMGEDELAFCTAISHWAISYADQVEHDYALFIEWVSVRKNKQA